MGQHKVSLKQLAATASKNATTTESMLKLSEKAEVFLDRAEIHGHNAGRFEDSCWLELTVKNCGRTKAENIAGDFQLIVNNQVLHSLPIKPTNLGAGQAQDITFPRFKNIVSPKTLFDQVLRGEVETQFYGSYNYREVFGESGTRECRGTLRSESNTVTIDQRT